jgi:hypothetical protein
LQGLSDLKAWQLSTVAYGVLYFLLAGLMEADYVAHQYPGAYIVLSMVTQVLIVFGIFIFALQRAAPYATAWRWLFPLMIAELGLGIFFDTTTTSPEAPLDQVWMLNMLFGLWLMAPAYYFNFRVARARST